MLKPLALAALAGLSSADPYFTGSKAGINTEFAPKTAGICQGYRCDVGRTGIAAPDTRVGNGYVLKWWSEETMVTDYSASRSQPTVLKDKVIWGADTPFPTVWAYDRNSGEIAWNYTAKEKTSHGIHGTLWAVNDDFGVVGDYGGHVHALNLKDGSLIWKTDLQNFIGSAPVVYKNLVFVTIETAKGNGWIAALDAATGEQLWGSPPLGGHPHASPTIDSRLNYVCAGCNVGRVECFDFNPLLKPEDRSEKAAEVQAQACEKQAENDARGDARGKKAKAKKGRRTRKGNVANVWVGAMDDTIDPEEDAELNYSLPRCGLGVGSNSADAPPTKPFSVWMSELRNDIPGFPKDVKHHENPKARNSYLDLPMLPNTWRGDSPKSSFKDVPVTQHPGLKVDLMAHEGSDDDEAIHLMDRADVKSTIAIHPDEDLMYITAWNRLLYCFRVSTGDMLWRYVMGRGSMSSPAIDPVRNVVVVGAMDMYMHGVDALTGKGIWRVATRGEIRSSAVVVLEENRGVAVMGSADGVVYFVDTKDGALLQRVIAPSSLSNPVTVVDKELFILDHAGYLTAYEALF